MRRLMKSVAKDISDDFSSRLKVDSNAGDRLLLRFSKMIARQIVRQLLKEARKNPKGVMEIFANTKNPGKISSGLQKVEGKLTKVIEKGLANNDDDNDEDETKGTGAKLPNLKYAKSKYKNVESILKYVESKDDKNGGGIKLVIMNFND